MKKKTPKKKCSRTSSVSSHSTTISTREMQNIVEKLKNQRHRGTTQRNYYGIWKTFNHFFLKLDKRPPTWNERLTLFVAYLVKCKKQSSTVKSYISAIKAVLRSINIKITQDEYLLNSLTKACRLNNDRVINRLPITKGMLAIIIRRIQDTYEQAGQPYLATLLSAIISSAYFGLFRISDLVETPSKHAVLVRDVQTGTNKKKFMFVLKSSKTHCKGTPPQIVKISSTANKNSNNSKINSLKPPCPHELLARYIET